MQLREDGGRFENMPLANASACPHCGAGAVARARLALGALGAGTAAWDIRTHQVTCDDIVLELFGFDAAPAAGGLEAWAQRIHPADLEPLVRIAQASVHSGTPLVAEYRARSRNGGWRVISTRAVVVNGTDGMPEKVVGLSRDVTEERSASDRLARYEQIVECSPDLISFVGTSYDYLAINHAYCRAHGLPRGGIVGRPVAEVMGTQLFEAEIKPRLDRCLAGETIEWDSWFEYAGMGRRYVRVSYLPYVAQNGQIEGVVVVARDITDGKLREEERLQAEQRLQQAQRMEMLGQLAGGLAHDFANFLHLMGLYLAPRGEADCGAALSPSDVESLREAATRANGLVRQLLGLARNQASAKTEVDLTRLIQETVKLLRPTVGSRIDLTFEQPNQPLRLSLDASGFEQILVNLVLNARDAIPHTGAVTIKVHSATPPAGELASFPWVLDRPHVVVSIRDNGMGIAPEDLPRIFEPFFSTKTPCKGSGLGLATAFRIARQHDGFIRADSVPGKETTFEVYLPWGRDPIPTPEAVEGSVQ